MTTAETKTPVPIEEKLKALQADEFLDAVQNIDENADSKVIDAYITEAERKLQLVQDARNELGLADGESMGSLSFLKIATYLSDSGIDGTLDGKFITYCSTTKIDVAKILNGSIAELKSRREKSMSDDEIISKRVAEYRVRLEASGASENLINVLVEEKRDAVRTQLALAKLAQEMQDIKQNGGGSNRVTQPKSPEKTFEKAKKVLKETDGSIPSKIKSFFAIKGVQIGLAKQFFQSVTAGVAKDRLIQQREKARKTRKEAEGKVVEQLEKQVKEGINLGRIDAILQKDSADLTSRDKWVLKAYLLVSAKRTGESVKNHPVLSQLDTLLTYSGDEKDKIMVAVDAVSDNVDLKDDGVDQYFSTRINRVAKALGLNTKVKPVKESKNEDETEQKDEKPELKELTAQEIIEEFGFTAADIPDEDEFDEEEAEAAYYQQINDHIAVKTTVDNLDSTTKNSISHLLAYITNKKIDKGTIGFDKDQALDLLRTYIKTVSSK